MIYHHTQKQKEWLLTPSHLCCANPGIGVNVPTDAFNDTPLFTAFIINPLRVNSSSLTLIVTVNTII